MCVRQTDDIVWYWGRTQHVNKRGKQEFTDMVLRIMSYSCVQNSVAIPFDY